MKITYKIDETKFANMVIAGKNRISTKAKTTEASTKAKVNEDLEMC